MWGDHGRALLVRLVVQQEEEECFVVHRSRGVTHIGRHSPILGEGFRLFLSVHMPWKNLACVTRVGEKLRYFMWLFIAVGTTSAGVSLFRVRVSSKK